MKHRLAILPGDGIGTEVTAAALEVVDATGCRLRSGAIRSRRRAIPAYRRGASRRRARRDPQYRRDPHGRDGSPRRPARGARARDHPAAAVRPRSLRERAAVPGRSERVQRRRRHDRDPREHRGHLRRRGWVPAQGHRARGRDAGFGEHPDGCRAVRALRVRPRPFTRAPPPHARAQDERAHVRRRPLAADVRHRRGRVPRRRDRRTTTSTRRASTSCRTRAATT